jgi:hypothetical protein
LLEERSESRLVNGFVGGPPPGRLVIKLKRRHEPGQGAHQIALAKVTGTGIDLQLAQAFAVFQNFPLRPARICYRQSFGCDRALPRLSFAQEKDCRNG